MKKLLIVALLLAGLSLFAQQAEENENQPEVQVQEQTQTQTQAGTTQDLRARFQNIEVYRDTEESQIQVDDLKPGQSTLKERQASKWNAGAKRVYLERFQKSNKLLY